MHNLRTMPAARRAPRVPRLLREPMWVLGLVMLAVLTALQEERDRQAAEPMEAEAAEAPEPAPEPQARAPG